MRVLLACLLLIATPLSAQTTASLVGSVTSGDAPLGDVTVVVRSPALQGTRSTSTSANGAYHFDELPPGDYTIEFTRRSFAAVTARASLRLAQTSRVDARLFAQQQEAIEVTAPAVETPEVATNLALAEVEKLPVLRNQLATAQLAPGVIGNVLANGQLQISGGPGYDNLVLVNGVVVTENVRGQMRPLYVEDAIQETTILTGAISAEYGRFTGGVVNTITRWGGNELTGSLRDSLSNPAWSAQTPAGEEREDALNHVVEATLGGYVLRDRLWFFTAGRWAKNDTARQTIAVPAFHGPASTPASPQLSYNESNDQKRYEAKLTAQPLANHSLVASYFGVDTQVDNARTSNNIYDAASLTKRDDPESLVAVYYSGTLTNALLVSAQYSRREMSLRSGAFTTDAIAGTVLLDRANNNTRFNSPSLCAICDAERRDNDDLLLKAHLFLPTAMGTHDIVAGADRFEESRYANNRQSGSDFSLFVTRAQFRDGTIYPVITPTTQNGGGTFLRWTPVLVAARENELRTDSLFVNDRWTPTPRWSVSAGLRWDRNHAEDSDGVVSADDSRLTPRLAVQFDPRGNGRQRVTASYAEYASRIADSIASSNQAAGNAAAIDFAYRGPAINDRALNVPLEEAIRMVLAYFNSQQGGTANTAANNLRANGNRSIPGFATYFDGTLRSPYVRELTLGYATEIGTSGYARVDVISRDWRDFYAASVTGETRRTNTPLGIPVDLALVRNSNNIERTYRGVQLQAGWSRARFTSGVHYTYAKLRGNDEGESGATGASANVDTTIYYPELLNYERYRPIGYLPGDQRHRVRAWAGYDFGALNVSLLQSIDSALAYSMAGPVVSTRYAGAPTGLPYNTSPNGLYYFSDRGALRLDDVYSTDVAVRYDLRHLFVQADVLNVFNSAAVADPLRVGTTVTTAATSPNLQPFNPFTQAPVEGVHYQRAANFGQPLNDQAYQRPRTFRVAVGARF